VKKPIPEFLWQDTL